jgi:flagellar L-ring protein precursor FlgH
MRNFFGILGAIFKLNTAVKPRGDELSVRRGDELSVPRGDELSVPRGDELSVQRCDELSVPRCDELSVPRCDELSVPRCDALSVPRCGIIAVVTSRSVGAGRDLVVPRLDRGISHPLKTLLLIPIILSLTACEILTPPVLYPPALPIDRPPPPKTRGTIYQAGHEILLYEDNIARRIGDVLTVKLEESTQGEYRAKTKTDKKTLNNYPMPILFGKPVPGLTINTNTEQSLDGTGNSDQSNKLHGTISVTVTGVLSNHNLVIQGESWVTINQGQEYIQLTGIVRPVDIMANNIISSQRIAGAQIKYGARGQAGYATRGGLFTQVLNTFFPY